jgi:hypothetical protein
MRIKPLTEEEILALPPAVDIPTAGRCFGLGRTASYALARAENFPVEVLELGPQSFRVTKASICAKLGIKDPATAAADPGDSADSGATSQSAA